MVTEALDSDILLTHQLRIVSPEGSEYVFLLDVADECYMVGRSRDCQIKLKDASVSRHHLRITFDSEGSVCVQRDKRGRTAPYINDSIIEGDEIYQLQTTDVIKVGSSILTLEAVSPVGSNSDEEVRNDETPVHAVTQQSIEIQEDPNGARTSADTRYMPKSEIDQSADVADEGQTSYLPEDDAKAVLDTHKKNTKNKKYMVLFGAFALLLILMLLFKKPPPTPKKWVDKDDYSIMLSSSHKSYASGLFAIYEEGAGSIAVYHSQQGFRWSNYATAVSAVSDAVHKYLEEISDLELSVEEESWFGQKCTLVSRQSDFSTPYASIVSKQQQTSKYSAAGRIYLAGDEMFCVLAWRRHKNNDRRKMLARLHKQLEGFMLIGIEPDGIDRRKVSHSESFTLETLRKDALRWFNLREAEAGNAWEAYHRYMQLYHYISNNGVSELPPNWDEGDLWKEISSVADYLSMLVNKHRNTAVAAKHSGDWSTAIEHAQIIQSEIPEPRDFRWISAQKIIDDTKSLRKKHSGR